MTIRARQRAMDPTALIIDADSVRRGALGRWVAGAGFRPRAAESPEKARCELAQGDFEFVLANPEMLDQEGFALFDKLASGTAPVTGACSGSAATESLSSTNSAKPPPLARFGRLIGSSAPMQRVYDQLLRVAPTMTTVFLHGESGTGKELAAEVIHGLSPRAAKPFVPVNCGALSPGLIESEFFGHERGSFTGADRRRVGLFERAQGGTLFLDEVTEMPLDLQAKLLRVVESGEVRRVGGDGRIEVDVRVIAATNRNPEEAVASGALRRDLLYRLLVFPIELPPLRRRSDDVTQIASHYLDELNEERPCGKRLTSEALEQLRGQHWPGNVRELRNAVERAFILADEEIPASCFAPGRPDRVDGEDKVLGVRVGMPIAEAERRLILATLEQLRGDKKRTATTLGISLKTLYSRLSVYRASGRD